MDQQILQSYENFQLTSSHQSDIWDIIEQRALSLNQPKFHWFVRLQSLLFVTDQIMKDQSSTSELEFLATKTKDQIISLIQENKPNYQGPLVQLIVKFVLYAPAAIYKDQQILLEYLCQNSFNEFLTVLQNFPINGLALAKILELLSDIQVNQVLDNVEKYIVKNHFSLHLQSGIYNNKIEQIFMSFQEKIEQVDQYQQDEGQTMVLLKQAENLIGSVEYQPQYQNYQQDQGALQQTQLLQQKLNEYEETIRVLQEETPYNQVQQLQLELAQTRQAFDQLMNKYQSQKTYTQELEYKAQQYNEKIHQFKQLFEQANIRYEEMKRVANERIAQLRQGSGDTQEMENARQEIAKLKSEKAQLSDITKKLITKLNNK